MIITKPAIKRKSFVYFIFLNRYRFICKYKKK